MNIGQAVGVAVTANILASAQVLPRRWRLQPSRRNCVVFLAESLVGVGDGCGGGVNKRQVRITRAEVSFAGSCSDIGECHKHSCDSTEGCLFNSRLF